MKKRLKMKLAKKSNMAAIQSVLKKVYERFTVGKVRYGNGYFIFYKGPNSVCHFSIKETPGWKYGIWLGHKGQYEIFGEHIDLIDKFKPSRTYVSHMNDMESFLKQVQAIQENPKLYFVDSLTMGDALIPFEKEAHGEDIWYRGYQSERVFNEETGLYDKFVRHEEITQKEFVERKYNEFYEEKKQHQANIEADRKYVFDFFKSIPTMYPQILAVGIQDLNKGGIISSPRYYLHVVVAKNTTDEEVDRIYGELDKKSWEKQRIEVMKTFDHGFRLENMYDDLKDIRECDYKFYA